MALPGYSQVDVMGCNDPCTAQSWFTARNTSRMAGLPVAQVLSLNELVVPTSETNLVRPWTGGMVLLIAYLNLIGKPMHVVTHAVFDVAPLARVVPQELLIIRLRLWEMHSILFTSAFGLCWPTPSRSRMRRDELLVTLIAVLSGMDYNLPCLILNPATTYRHLKFLLPHTPVKASAHLSITGA